jgi:hypothetical protein
MFSNTLIASAEMPAGPVTFTWSPGGAPVPTTSRYLSTGSRISPLSPLPVALIRFETSAVVPSRESWNGSAARAPAGLPKGVVLENARVASFSWRTSSRIAARSRAVRPLSRR